MDLQVTAGLPADRADAPPASQPDGHDDRVAAELTSMTDAPRRRSSRFNAVVMRTSSSW